MNTENRDDLTSLLGRPVDLAFLGSERNPYVRADIERTREAVHKVPSATTRKAIKQLEAGKGKRFDSVDDLMTDLHADD